MSFPRPTNVTPLTAIALATMVDAPFLSTPSSTLNLRHFDADGERGKTPIRRLPGISPRTGASSFSTPRMTPRAGMTPRVTPRTCMALPAISNASDYGFGCGTPALNSSRSAVSLHSARSRRSDHTSFLLELLKRKDEEIEELKSKCGKVLLSSTVKDSSSRQFTKEQFNSIAADQGFGTAKAEAMFSASDVAGEGVLSSQEYGKVLFSLLSQQADSKVSAQQFSHLALQAGFTANEAAVHFTHADKNADGVIDFSEITTAYFHTLCSLRDEQLRTKEKSAESFCLQAEIIKGSEYGEGLLTQISTRQEELESRDMALQQMCEQITQNEAELRETRAQLNYMKVTMMRLSNGHQEGDREPLFRLEEWVKFSSDAGISESDATEMFKQADEKETGELSFIDFSKMMLMLFQKTKGTRLNFSEFTKLAAEHGIETSQIEEMFSHLDVHREGFEFDLRDLANSLLQHKALSAAEVSRENFITRCEAEGLTSAQANILFDSADTDGDGKVDLDELSAALMKAPSLLGEEASDMAPLQEELELERALRHGEKEIADLTAAELRAQTTKLRFQLTLTQQLSHRQLSDIDILKVELEELYGELDICEDINQRLSESFTTASHTAEDLKAQMLTLQDQLRASASVPVDPRIAERDAVIANQRQQLQDETSLREAVQADGAAVLNEQKRHASQLQSQLQTLRRLLAERPNPSLFRQFLELATALGLTETEARAAFGTSVEDGGLTAGFTEALHRKLRGICTILADILVGEETNASYDKVSDVALKGGFTNPEADVLFECYCRHHYLSDVLFYNVVVQTPPPREPPPPPPPPPTPVFLPPSQYRYLSYSEYRPLLAPYYYLPHTQFC